MGAHLQFATSQMASSLYEHALAEHRLLLLAHKRLGAAAESMPAEAAPRVLCGTSFRLTPSASACPHSTHRTA